MLGGLHAFVPDSDDPAADEDFQVVYGDAGEEGGAGHTEEAPAARVSGQRTGETVEKSDRRAWNATTPAPALPTGAAPARRLLAVLHNLGILPCSRRPPACATARPMPEARLRLSGQEWAQQRRAFTSAPQARLQRLAGMAAWPTRAAQCSTGRSRSHR